MPVGRFVSRRWKDQQVTDSDVAYVVRRFYGRLLNAWDDSAVDQTLAAELTFRGSLGQSTRGRDDWRAYRDGIRRAARPTSTTRSSISSLTVTRAATRLQCCGTHTGVLLGQPPTGRRFGYSGAAFFTARGELLTDAWVLGDLDSLRAQLR
jgi:predicted ester cyclase